MSEHLHPETSEPTASDGSLDPKVGGLVAYLTWIGGLIMFVTQKHIEVRFHAAQCILASIVLAAVYIALGIIQIIAGLIFWWLGALVGVLYGIVGLAALVLWIFLIIRGYNLVHFKLPVIGNIAEKWAAK